jgi:hypothetical protein
MTALLTPAYRLTIGHRVADTTVEPKASATTDLIVTLDLDARLDTVELVLGQVGGIAPKLDDEAKIELGYADDGGFTQVFDGVVNFFEPGLLTRRVVAVSNLRALARLFVDETFEGQTAGAIVKDLAGRAKVDVANADDGISFPAYVVDSRRTALAHMRDLAELCGFDCYANADGALVFEAFAGGNAIHDVDYAKQILELDIDRWSGTDVAVTAWGESATGSSGAEAWGWLTKDFSSSAGHAGGGTPAFSFERPVLRTAESASTAATSALHAFARRAVRGRVVIPGQANVALGDAVRLRDVPLDGFDDTYQVRSVVHRITKQRGFTTAIGFAAIPAGVSV